MHSAPRERRVESNAIHSRRRQNQLPRCRGHTDSRDAGSQNAIQQRHINRRSKIYDHGHIQLLFEYTITMTRIYKDQLKRHPRGSNHRIRTEEESIIEWEHLHQSAARNVRITTGGITGKRAAREAIE